MKHPLSLALAAILAGTLTACAHSPATESAVTQSAQLQQSNPFFAESTLPLRYPHFDRIKDEHFAPAFDAGMAQNLKEVEAIANNPEPPTFDNTLIPLEKSGETLGRASSVFFNLVGTDTNDTRKKLQADYAPKFAAHRDAIALNPKLY
ncbi:MAG: dipeptidyl carboxypeptidase II, partial [Luteimonas sp.]